MANPFVSSIISTAPVGASRPGFGVAGLLSYNASAFGAGERLRLYAGTDEVLADFPSTSGPEMLWATALFSQSVRPDFIAILKGLLPPTQLYIMAALAATAGATYPINVQGDGVTSTAISLTLPLTDVTISAVANATETFTAVAHGMTTGQGPYRLTNSGGALPAGVAVDTDYWVYVVTVDTFRLATTRANALAGTVQAITTDGTGTHTLRRTTNDTLIAQLVQALNDVVGKNYTAAQVTGVGETDTLTITASAAGEWYSIEVPDHALSLLSVAQTHADPGIATDLAAIANVSNGGEFYVLHTAYNSNAVVAAAAAWVEAQTDPRRTYHVGLHNSLTATATVGGAGNDTADNLKSAGYARTTSFYNTAPRTFLDGAVSGRLLPVDPGGVEATAKQLVGAGLAVALTSTQYANLAAKNVNYYTTAEGTGTTVGGKSVGGEWWDVTRDDDSVNADMRISLYELRQANDKIGFTDGGIAQVEATVRAVLKRAVDATIYESPVVVAPKASAVSTINRTGRRLPISWSATRVGAVVFIDATGTVS